MRVEECGDLSEGCLCLGGTIIELVLSMSLPVEDFELRIDAGFAQLAIGAHGVAQQQIARSGSQDRWFYRFHSFTLRLW